MYNQAPSVAITITRVTDTQYRATINKDWSETVSLIRPGYVVTTNDGGSGIVYLVNGEYIYMTPTSPFTRQYYLSGDWSLFVPTVSDVAKFLPELFKDTKLIPELFQTLQKVVNDVDDSVLRLNYAKDYTKCDIGILPDVLSDLGIDFYTEQTTTSVLKRMLQESVPYNKYAGELKSLDYIGIAFDAKLEFIQMWTRDYQQFYEADGLPYDRTGLYPTNYVRIRYTKKNKDLSTEAIRSIFYKLAWICLVIFDIELVESFETTNLHTTSAAVPCTFIAFKSPDQATQDRLDFVYGDIIPMPVYSGNPIIIHTDL